MYNSVPSAVYLVPFTSIVFFHIKPLPSPRLGEHGMTKALSNIVTEWMLNTSLEHFLQLLAMNAQTHRGKNIVALNRSNTIPGTCRTIKYVFSVQKRFENKIALP